MASEAHFVKLSKGMHRQWMNDGLLDLKLVTVDRPVGMHKVVLMVFSSFYQQLYAKTGQIRDIGMRDYTSDQVCKLLDFLYSGETTDGIPTELIRHLKLDLSIEQPKSLSEKVNLKGEQLKQFKVLMEYLRIYTLEIEVRKLLYNNRAWSDVIIRTGKYVHKCHKVILSVFSAYFEVMFSSGMKEADEKIINLHGVETKIFSNVLTFIYTGRLDISVRNAQELLTTSVYMQIQDLQLLCEEFMLHQMDMGNCVDMLKLARSHYCHTLESGSWDFIVDNFENIGKQRLKGLDKEEVMELLSNDNLNVVDETAVLMFVLRWTMDDQSARETQLFRLLQKVRLTLLKPDLLTEIVNNNEVINKNETCVKLVKESIDKIHKGEIDLEPRKETTFLVIQTSNRKSCIEVVAYSITRNKWYSLSSNTRVHASSGIAACASNSHVYITGGRAQPKQACVFSVDRNDWRSLADMNNGRCAHSSAFLDGSIYVLGGTDVSAGKFGLLSSIEKFDEKLNAWETIGHLEIPTYYSACAVVKSSIYILGGATGIPAMDIKDIQCFNTLSATCTILYHSLPIPVRDAVSCSHNSGIYLTYPHGEVILFNQDESPTYLINKVLEICIPSITYKCYGCLYHNNAIYTLLRSLFFESTDARMFNLRTKTNSTVEHMKLPFEKHSNEIFSTVMHVGRRHLTTTYTCMLESESSELEDELNCGSSI